MNSQQQMSALNNLRNPGSQSLLQQQQMLLNSNSLFRQQFSAIQPIQLNQPPQPRITNSRDGSKDKDKLFGRAAFHVAIAYHIHLKKIK